MTNPLGMTIHKYHRRLKIKKQQKRKEVKQVQRKNRLRQMQRQMEQQKDPLDQEEKSNEESEVVSEIDPMDEYRRKAEYEANLLMAKVFRDEIENPTQQYQVEHPEILPRTSLQIQQPQVVTPLPIPTQAPISNHTQIQLVATAVLAKPSTVKKSGIDLTKANTTFLPPQLAKKKATDIHRNQAEILPPIVVNQEAFRAVLAKPTVEDEDKLKDFYRDLHKL